MYVALEMREFIGLRSDHVALKPDKKSYLTYFCIVLLLIIVSSEVERKNTSAYPKRKCRRLFIKCYRHIYTRRSVSSGVDAYIDSIMSRLSASEHNTYMSYLWHDQEEWVGCRLYFFWDIGKNSVPIPLFYIVFSIVKFFITLPPDIHL